MENYLTQVNDISNNINIIDVIVNSIICIFLSLVLKYVFLDRSKTLSNRFQFSNLLPILALTVYLVISVVKSSLALSLGLVGALSIVRFRTPIKEPEELLYLFIAISIGLGLAANQAILTTIVFSLLIILIYISSYKKNYKENDYNLIIEFKQENPNQNLELIKNIVKNSFPIVEFVKFEILEKPHQLIIFKVSMKDLKNISSLENELSKNLNEYKLSYYESNILV